VFTATLCNHQRGAVLPGSARHGENIAFLIVALRVFGLEVFNGQLPSNAVTIHVTLYFTKPNIFF
jgi:hypothetical protein